MKHNAHLSQVHFILFFVGLWQKVHSKQVQLLKDSKKNLKKIVYQNNDCCRSRFLRSALFSGDVCFVINQSSFSAPVSFLMLAASFPRPSNKLYKAVQLSHDEMQRVWMNVTVLAAIFAHVIVTSRFSRTVLVIKVRWQNITCIPISRPFLSVTNTTTRSICRYQSGTFVSATANTCCCCITRKVMLSIWS